MLKAYFKLINIASSIYGGATKESPMERQGFFNRLIPYWV